MQSPIAQASTSMTSYRQNANSYTSYMVKSMICQEGEVTGAGYVVTINYQSLLSLLTTIHKRMNAVCNIDKLWMIDVCNDGKLSISPTSAITLNYSPPIAE